MIAQYERMEGMRNSPRKERRLQQRKARYDQCLRMMYTAHPERFEE